MNLYFRCFFLCISLFPLFSHLLYTQPTVGLLNHAAGKQDGYVLFAPGTSTTTYLIDKCGRKVHSWKSDYRPGQSVYLLNDGSLLRAGSPGNPHFPSPGVGGVIEKINWDGTVAWDYQLSDSTQCQHHDVYPMPNGNVLAIVWVARSNSYAVAAGRDPNKTPNKVWGEKIIEIKPDGQHGGTIVWEWIVWEHVIQENDRSKPNYGKVADHPELINLNYINAASGDTIDWIHANSVAYNPILDQIMVSSQTFSEIWIIDHSTTTAQAATHSGGKSGKGGDILYRWGNPATYNCGTEYDQRLFGQHSAHWIEKGLPDAGKVMIFNNGLLRPNSLCSVDIIAPVVNKKGIYKFNTRNQFEPSEVSWSYSDTRGLFVSPTFSGAQRLPNGNTLICLGAFGLFSEVTPTKTIVWQYKSPVGMQGPVAQGTDPGANNVFRCTQYPINYPAFQGKQLQGDEPIELNPYPVECP
ncbi:MAG: aryl-sulfate sulfotransferase [Ignavibacteria bacterium]|nr:aryl-sulfate sulfotransferase [Ignavibacteria bacterium]